MSSKALPAIATPAAAAVLVMRASVALTRLSIAMKTQPRHCLYGVDRLGAIGAFVVGVTVLGEPLTVGRILAAALIVAGLAIMKLAASGSTHRESQRADSEIDRCMSLLISKSLIQIACMP